MRLCHLLPGLLLLLAQLCAPRAASAAPLAVYQIGNSWTCLSQGAWDIAQSLGSPYTRGYHIAWNQTLTNIWAGAHDFSTPSRLQTALPGNVWDIVELQPWYETWIDAARAGSNMVWLTLQTSPNAKILIFACGPESSQGPYLTTWNRTDQQNYTQQNFWKSKLNYELVVNSLRTNFPGTQIGLVPMGHCIARVATLLQNGTNVPGVTSVNDLLEQGGQHTSTLGTYIGQLAAYSTFFQQRPHGSTLTNLANCQSSRFSVTPQFAAFMWDLVWDVVLNEPYTLVKPGGSNNLAAFNFPGFGPATISGTNVTLTVPYGTVVTNLSPTFNLSAGATCVPTSGSTQNFSTPVQYVVSSAAPVATQTYLVTVTVAPYVPPRIGVQRAGGLGGGGTQLTADQQAGAPGFEQVNWNTMSTFTSSANGLKDSKGAVTTAGFNSNSDGISPISMGTASTQPDEILHTAGQYRIWGDWTINFTGIPYSNYSLVFYETGPSARGAQATRLTGGPTYYLSQTHSGSAAGYVDGNNLTPFTYIRATSTNAASPTVDGNYVVFSGLTGATQTVTIPGGFQVINTFNAFQIVDNSPAPGPQADIVSFSFGALGAATIAGTNISITVTNGTVVTALAPTYTLSAGATCNRTSGSTQDFTSPVSYTVTSSDGLIIKTYLVTVTVAPPVTQPKDILTFGLPGNAAVISGTNITLTVPFGTAVTNLAPTYTVSAGATCVPTSGSTQNFSAPLHYVVSSAPPVTTKDYLVTVVVTPASSAKDILTFGPGATVNSNTIAWTVPFGTPLTNLAPTFTISPLAVASPVSGTARDFTTPKTYTITAQDGSTKLYTVTVTVAPQPSSGVMIGVQRAGGLGGGGTQLTATQRAGAPGFVQSNWNARSSFSVGGSPLKDSSGATTTAIFTVDSGGVAAAMGNAAPGSPDEILFSGAAYRTWGDWTITITGIPYANYSMVFYEMTPSARGAQGTRRVGGPTYYLSQTHPSTAAGYIDNNAATPFTYIQATSTNAAAPTVDANYIVFTGLTGATQTVVIPGGFQIINTFSAFQIVNTPPTTNNFVIILPPTPTTGAFTYTRRANSGLTYSIWTSTNLTTWTQDTGATVGTVTTTNGVETVPITLSPALLANPKLFVRVQGQ